MSTDNASKDCKKNIIINLLMCNRITHLLTKILQITLCKVENSKSAMSNNFLFIYNKLALDLLCKKSSKKYENFLRPFIVNCLKLLK